MAAILAGERRYINGFVQQLEADHCRSRRLSEKSVAFYLVRLEHYRAFLAGEMGREPNLDDSKRSVRVI